MAHGLSSRLAHASGNVGKGAFAELDRSTSVHKTAEEAFSKAVMGRGYPVPEPKAVVTFGTAPESFDPRSEAFFRAVSALAVRGS